MLALLGVALGVAVVVAMDLGLQSAREAFSASARTVAGSATHQVVGGPAGVPDTVPALLRRSHEVRAAAPVIEGYVLPVEVPASAEGPPREGRPAPPSGLETSPVPPDEPVGRPLRLLGVDPFSEAAFRPYLAGGPGRDLDGSLLLTEPGGVFLSRETATALGIAEGDAFRVLAGGRVRELRAVGVLEPADEGAREGLRDLLVMDVAEAQDLVGRPGRIDRVDLFVPDGAGGDRVEAWIREALPYGTRLEAAGTRARALGSMIGAFDLNLRALSLLALLFGIFLIYSTMTFSVVRRRPTLGVLRALGASRPGITRAVLGEAAVIGTIGGVLGVLGGIVLGRGLVRLVTRTINDLYFVVSVEGLAVPSGVLLKGLALGVGAAVLASVPAAREAVRVQPREAMTRASLEESARSSVRRWAIGGAGLCAIGGLVLVVSAGVLGAFAGLFMVTVGLALLAPAATTGLAHLVRRPLRAGIGVVGAMAARGVVTALSRTGPAMVALVIGVSVAVGIGVMIQSFRGSVEGWLDDTLGADLYVSVPGALAARPDGRLPDGLAPRVAGIPGVAGVEVSRSLELFPEDLPVRLVVAETLGEGRAAMEERGPAHRRPAGRDLLAATARAMERFRAGDGVLVSEPYAVRNGVAPGDTLVLPGEEVPVALEVLGVYRDYGSEAGTIRIARERFERHWSEVPVTSLAVYLDVEAEPSTVESRIREAAGPASILEVRSNRALRESSLEVFDRTFAITRVLRGLALVVAFVAVLSALMALQLERAPEIAVLRANGMTPGQTWGLVTTQTGLMGTIAGLLAVPVGLTLAAIMIRVVNRRSFGWSMEMEIGPDILIQALVLALVGALAAGLYPSWRMARTAPAAALRGE